MATDRDRRSGDCKCRRRQMGTGGPAAREGGGSRRGGGGEGVWLGCSRDLRGGWTGGSRRLPKRLAAVTVGYKCR